MLNRIKIILLLALLTSTILVAVPALASTQDDIAKQLKAAGDKAGTTEVQDPRAIAMTIVRIAFGLIGTVFLCLTMYAGYMWMTAGGEEEKVTKAKSLLTQAVIGLAIILLSYSITIFVVRSLTTVDQSRIQYEPIL
ncbi:hypothetical protein KKA13_01320 [Patescibacteria group bacterium]|nr:hypothetical protein [Patescibacteria group bacterium]MBU1612849.1 hypothetical protein [Patescibacteria group bacterium]